MKRFFVVWVSQVASLFGSSIVSFALVWYLTKETGSAVVLSIAMMVGIIPGVVLGPFIGPFIDRWNRKKIMIFSDLISMFLTVVLIFLFYNDVLQVWHIYLILIGRSIAGSFQTPALQASIPMIVQKKDLGRVNGFNQILRGLISVVSPPAGAFLIELLPMHGVVAVDVVTAIIAVGCLIPLAIPQPSRTTLSIKPNIINDMVQGFRYIMSLRGLSVLFILVGLISFFGAPSVSLTPLFITKYLEGGVFELGWIQTAVGVGVIAGGLLMGAWGGFKKHVNTFFVGMITQSVMIILFTFLNKDFFVLGLVLWFMLGLGNAVTWAPLHAIQQSTVAKDMQGRAFSVLGSFTGAMRPLGLAIAGPLADFIGVRAVFACSGAIILILVIAGSFSRDLKNIESQRVEMKPTIANAQSAIDNRQ